MDKAYEQSKKDLIARYLETRTAILDAAASLPEESHSMAFVGEWTIRELLAHLCGWDHTYKDAFDQILDGQLPEFFSDYDHNWQRFNNRLVTKYRQNNLERMIARVKESQEQLAAFLHDLPDEKIFDDCGICTEHGFNVTISSLMESIIIEENEHLQEILDFKSSIEAQEQEPLA